MSYRGPITPDGKPPGLGCSAFARHYLRNHFRFLFLRLLRCFTSAGIALMSYVFTHTLHKINCVGLPHSEILGLTRAYRFPRLIAVCHVLHRHSVPGHSSCTFFILI